MGVVNYVCSMYLDYLQQELPELKYIYAHENGIKDIPIKEITVALSIKKMVVGKRIVDDEESIDDSTMRASTVTLGINFYTPHSMGVSAAIDAFDDVMSIIMKKSWADIAEIRLLGTSYSREAQALITKAEFDFNWIILKPHQTTQQI